jgi:hypothetical protein
MQRIEPAFPDLLPVSHRLGPVPVVAGGRAMALDPVEMRLVWQTRSRRHRAGDRTLPRRPVPVLLHARSVREEREHLNRLLAGGCGALVVLDDEISPADLPPSAFAGQLVVMAPWLPSLWGGLAIPDLLPWRRRGFAVGVLLCLGPAPDPFEEVVGGVQQAKGAGAEFMVASPLALPPADRHRAYDGRAGEEADGELENLLFHTDLGHLAAELEREASRACRQAGLSEGLPGPATAVTPQATFIASAQLLLWARRLDLLDDVSSAGWRLRRAARALLASRRDPQALVAEDNLRVIPGFTPWVEAFARSLWGGSGQPFDEVLARWFGH